MIFLRMDGKVQEMQESLILKTNGVTGINKTKGPSYCTRETLTVTSPVGNNVSE